jgi:hypothetical protein
LPSVPPAAFSDCSPAIEPPRELKAFPYLMSWHPRLTNEPAHVWLRDQVRIAARSVRDGSRYGQQQFA